MRTFAVLLPLSGPALFRAIRVAALIWVAPTISLALALAALTASINVASGHPAQRLAVYDCIERASVAAAARWKESDPWDVFDPGPYGRFVDHVLAECRRDHPDQMAQLDRKTAAKLVNTVVEGWLAAKRADRTLNAEERSDLAKKDEHRDMGVYAACLVAGERALVAVSAENAETIIKAALGLCTRQQEQMIQTYERYGSMLGRDDIAHFEKEMSEVMAWTSSDIARASAVQSRTTSRQSVSPPTARVDRV
jgi:hypothetical protein